MKHQIKINSLISIATFLCLINIFVFFAILIANPTANSRYYVFNIPFGKEIVFTSVTCLTLIGLKYRINAMTLQRPVLLYVTTLMCLLLWGRLTSIITAREFVQFDAFILVTIAGLVIGSSCARYIVEFSLALSGIMISFSILILGFAPKVIGQIFLYNPEILETIDTGAQLFFRNSGTLLNNNTMGSVLTTLFVYLVLVSKLNSKSKFFNQSLFIIYVSIILSGNATGSILCTPIYLYKLLDQKEWINRKMGPLLCAGVLILGIFPMFSFFHGPGILEYKANSGALKLSIFIENFHDYFNEKTAILFGKKDVALMSESTLIDLLYYFGLPGVGLIMALVLFGCFSSLSKPYSGHIILFYFIFILLLCVQNSVLVPPTCFLFGVIMAYSSTNRIVFPIREISSRSSILRN